MEEQAIALLKELKGKDKIQAEQTTRMFNIHNALFPDVPEWSRHCPACRERVYNRLVQWASRNGHEI